MEELLSALLGNIEQVFVFSYLYTPKGEVYAGNLFYGNCTVYGIGGFNVYYVQGSFTM